jgi:hypothetical protein
MISMDRQYMRANTTTTGKCRDETPPGGKEKSLLKPKGLSKHPPLAVYGLELVDMLGPTRGPFPAAFAGSTFMSHIFLTFFS